MHTSIPFSHPARNAAPGALGVMIAALLVGLPAPAHARPASASAKATSTASKSKNAPAASTNTSEQAVLVIPKSVFVDDLKFGRDPFFPQSHRRTLTRTPTNESPREATFDSAIQYKGYSSVDGRKLAMISINGKYRTLAEGEESEYVSKGRTNRVRCVTIGDDEVTIEIGGSTRKVPHRQRPGL